MQVGDLYASFLAVLTKIRLVKVNVAVASQDNNQRLDRRSKGWSSRAWTATEEGTVGERVARTLTQRRIRHWTAT